MNENGNHSGTIWIVDLSVGGEGILFEFYSRFLSFFNECKRNTVQIFGYATMKQNSNIKKIEIDRNTAKILGYARMKQNIRISNKIIIMHL